jgi:hypothetical protein
MYKDDLWYRRLMHELEEHRENFTEKEIRRYRIPLMERAAKRVAEFSEKCATCKDYQHTLTRLEEEMHALPESPAQRDHQRATLLALGDHFRAEHDLSTPGHYRRRWLRLGTYAGIALGALAAILLGNTVYIFVAMPLGLLVGMAVGAARDAAYANRKRMV